MSSGVAQDAEIGGKVAVSRGTALVDLGAKLLATEKHNRF